MTKESQEYEKITQLILQQNLTGMKFDSDIVVEKDVKLEGKSGHQYQIDVMYSFEAFGIKYLTIVECKHYSSKIKVSHINDFKAKIDDVGAHKGIFVTTAGYQQGALKVALYNNIALVLLKGKKWNGILARRRPQSAETILGRFLVRLLNNFEIHPAFSRFDVSINVKPETYTLDIRRQNYEIVFDPFELSNGSDQIQIPYSNQIERDEINILINDKAWIPFNKMVKYLLAEDMFTTFQSILK